MLSFLWMNEHNKEFIKSVLIIKKRQMINLPSFFMNFTVVNSCLCSMFYRNMKEYEKYYYPCHPGADWLEGNKRAYKSLGYF